LQALKGLKSRLGDIKQYLESVIAGQLPVNNEIIGLVQDMFNLLPNLNIASLAQSLTGVHLSDRRKL
jgi:26S proteasome regulatory subunit N8